jgi:hypothetical protein
MLPCSECPSMETNRRQTLLLLSRLTSPSWPATPLPMCSIASRTRPMPRLRSDMGPRE